jgi:hypothetical protein
MLLFTCLQESLEITYRSDTWSLASSSVSSRPGSCRPPRGAIPSFRRWGEPLALAHVWVQSARCMRASTSRFLTRPTSNAVMPGVRSANCPGMAQRGSLVPARSSPACGRSFVHVAVPAPACSRHTRWKESAQTSSACVFYTEDRSGGLLYNLSYRAKDVQKMFRRCSHLFFTKGSPMFYVIESGMSRGNERRSCPASEHSAREPRLALL